MPTMTDLKGMMHTTPYIVSFSFFFVLGEGGWCGIDILRRSMIWQPVSISTRIMADAI